MRRQLRAFPAFLSTLVLAAVPLAAQPIFQTVAERGDPAPGFPGQVFSALGSHPLFGDLSAPPAVDADGNTAFHALVSADGEPGDAFDVPGHLFRLRGGLLEAAVRAGDPAPGVTGEFLGFRNSLGQTPEVEGGDITFIA